MRGARILYLDDSGKPDAGHSSQAVVIAGFAIDAERYGAFSKCVLGAKGTHFASRGAPYAWEVKSTSLIKPNPWKRRKNRDFVAEIARLISAFGGTAYSVTLDKRQMNHPMTLQTSMPLQLQALVEHFDAECRALDRTGMLIADWSSQHNDQHASRCVASFVGMKSLVVHPGVSYAGSFSCEGTQVADVIAGTRRRTAEGDATLNSADLAFASVKPSVAVGRTCKGRPYDNWVSLF